MKIPRRLLAAALVTLAAGCATTAQTPATVAAAAARTPELSTLSKLIADAGLTETLGSAGPYTLFAPSDDAFKAVPAKTMAELAADKALLKSVLSYHVVPTRLVSGEVKAGNAKTVQGANVSIALSGGFVTVEDALVTRADLPAGNGVVHVIDRVLMPPKR